MFSFALFCFVGGEVVNFYSLHARSASRRSAFRVSVLVSAAYVLCRVNESAKWFTISSFVCVPRCSLWVFVIMVIFSWVSLDVDDMFHLFFLRFVLCLVLV